MRRKNLLIDMRGIKIAAVLAFAAALLLSSCSGGNTSSDTGIEEAKMDSIAAFTTTDLDGNEITQDVFAEKDLTMINFWGTYCQPCKEEMPEIELLAQKYPDKFQVLGVVLDVQDVSEDSEEYKSALEIVEETGVTYRNVIAKGGLLDLALTIDFIPTTVFVDSEGNLVSDLIVGEQMAQYKKIVGTYGTDEWEEK